MNAQELQQRGMDARIVLENPLFVDAFERYERDIFDAWQKTIADEESTGKEAWKREELWRLMKCAQRFKQVFTSYMIEGENAKAISLDEERKKRFKYF